MAAPQDANAPDFVARVRSLAPDFLLSAYFRQILSPEMLAIPKRGAFNMHGSLLPRYRGRAPVNWVLVEGESKTGVTLHVMDPKPDRGDIVGQREIPITDEDTARTLHGKVAAAAGGLLGELWPAIAAGTEPRTPQDPSKAFYRGRRGPEDGRLDFSRPARACWNLVRAVTHPYPGAFTVADGKKLYVWKARIATPSEIEAASTRANAMTGLGGAAAERNAGAPGRVAGVVPGRGVLVASGEGSALLVESVQLEGQPERPAEELVPEGSLSLGRVLGR